MVQTCLQQALATFLPESRTLQPARWAARWWALLLTQSQRFPLRPPIANPNDAEPWQQRWNRLSGPQRNAFLLRVWLLLPPDDAATASGLEVDQSERQLAMASLQLRQAMGGDAQDMGWLDRLREAFDHLELGVSSANLDAPGHKPSQNIGKPRGKRVVGALAAAGLGCVLIGLAVALLLPRNEPLPEDIVLPQGSAGLVRASKGPQALPQDVTMLLDQDWPLWSNPEDGAMLRQLEFYAWLESNHAE